ncbi:phage portal protein [Leucobacter luti]|uniref:SPP1 Gp6-like portal protein n=1 Tax=Leucobacter luti TaxID=340320 RepID=A0A4Q7U079_9MICO|nr:phage portal protein [Leucobacter luti]MBL3699243.1 phage portal protein [Leucobacter luti]RZT66745.1 SPP1 Gp6-like portal protein [Leucobacter luti]
MTDFRVLSDDETKTFNKLHDQLNRLKRRNRLLVRYADSKKTLDQVGFSIPPHMASFQAVLGWPEKSCGVLTRRLRPRLFASVNDSAVLEDVNRHFSSTDVQLVERMAIGAAARHGVSFVFTSAGDTSIGEPEVVHSVCSALTATALQDPRSRRIVAALEVVDGGFNMSLPGQTLAIRKRGRDWGVVDVFPTTPGRVLCTAYVIGGEADQLFGRSRITRPVMALTDMAVRVMLRQEVSAEFFSSPQRYMLGATEDMFVGENGEPRTGWESMLGALLAVPDDEDKYENQRVTVGQFAQMSMQPHSDHLRTVAMMFSGETSIPSSFLGILHDNPSSAEAIIAHEAELVSIAETEIDWLNAARSSLALNAIAVLAGSEFSLSLAAEVSGFSPLWRDPSTPTRAATADAMGKEIAALPWMADSDVAIEGFGHDGPTVERLKAHRRRSSIAPLVERLAQTSAAQPAGQPVSPADELSAAQVLKVKADAVGVLRRAGVDANDAADRAGLPGLKFIPGQPITIKQADE